MTLMMSLRRVDAMMEMPVCDSDVDSDNDTMEDNVVDDNGVYDWYSLKSTFAIRSIPIERVCM